MHYTAALERWGKDLKGPRQLAALAEMDLEIENARAAWDWAAERVQAERLDRAIEGLGIYYDWRGRWQESEAAYRAAAEKLAGVASRDGPVLSPSTELRAGSDGTSAAERLRVLARILTWQGDSSLSLGRREASIQLRRRSLALLEGPEWASQDTRLERAVVLRLMSHQARGSDFERARRLGEQSLALYEELGDRWGMADALKFLGGRCMDLGAFGEAERLHDRSLALFQVLGDQRQIADSMLNLGVLASIHGQLDEAESLIRKSIAISREIMDRHGILWGLTWLGFTFSSSGRFAQAQSSLEEASAMLRGLEQYRLSALVHDFLARTEIHMGQWERASASAQMSLAVAQEKESAQGIALSFRLLSLLALTKGERGLDVRGPPRPSKTNKGQAAFIEAQRLARESAAILRELRDRQMLPSALLALGAAERALGNLDQARQQLCEALCVLVETGTFEPIMYALLAAALLLADLEEHERAVEIYALASRHPFVANSRWFELVYGRHIDAVAATLPPEVAQAARERGRARDLDATVKELLAELEVEPLSH